ncbi:MAG: bifunctional diaminohydroxyphosphoribosylaminopyrimidine deaminase/5-amino-6-(5-phosphoribosylamino)uracil reductase RibD, partial [Verrucomicrobiae bacterium]|nr:bifunctional diaminohydroxyphosphoribosylaminopyrimidine deaminase/5-amino-6-(5-phosphoribosylamino)uracil reductase RibD [Verrucomicrobiae bacterium]
MRFTAQEEYYMRRALTLARRALGLTSPNPMVGALVVKNRRVIAEGYHHHAGGPHAEIHALNAAGKRAAGADLYVTLEPCSTHGRTPPCTDAIIAAGIRRVVVAARDPNPSHDGRGMAVLRDAGIKVEIGLLGHEAARLNEAFNKWIRTGQPFVTVKLAMSLDGKIATRRGESRWITGEEARACVQELRRAADAILVGAGTVIADDPQLTVRAGKVERQPWRVIADSGGRTPLEARVLSDEHRARTIVLTTAQSASSWRRQLAERGVTVLECAARDERVDLLDALKQLGGREITGVLVEGGGQLVGSLLDQRLVDK